MRLCCLILAFIFITISMYLYCILCVKNEQSAWFMIWTYQESRADDNPLIHHTFVKDLTCSTDSHYSQYVQPITITYHKWMKNVFAPFPFPSFNYLQCIVHKIMWSIDEKNIKKQLQFDSYFTLPFNYVLKYYINKY